MIISRKDALEKVKQYATLLDKYIGKSCVLSWNNHTYTGVIPQSIELAKATDIKPEKREVDGKMRSPMFFTITTNEGKLNFPLDDTEVIVLGNGLRFRLGYDVELRME
jgi:hypothetical protein